MGFSKSPSSKPTARNIARLGERAMPVVMSWERLLSFATSYPSRKLLNDKNSRIAASPPFINNHACRGHGPSGGGHQWCRANIRRMRSTPGANRTGEGTSGAKCRLGHVLINAQDLPRGCRRDGQTSSKNCSLTCVKYITHRNGGTALALDMLAARWGATRLLT